MSQTYTIRCLSTALSPLSHMSRSDGNEGILAREPVMTPVGIRWLPMLSGNALRHKLIRAPGARFLVERWELTGKLAMRQLNFLFHGGQLTESSARQDPRGIAEMHRIFPLLRLIGGSLANAIVPGSLIVDRGMLACRENAGRIRAYIGWEVPKNLRAAEAFIESQQYTRGQVTNSAVDLVDPKDAGEEKTNLMIFSGQSVIAGAVFVHGFVLQNVSELEIGALLLSLSLWQSQGGTIGGQSARGHGRLDTYIAVDGIDAAATMQAYIQHVDSMREDGIAWLAKAFEPAEEPKDGKKKKGRPIETA